MFSRAATLPRVCLSCRLALARHHAIPRLYNGAAGSDRSRAFASDSNRTDKDRVEALISGSLPRGSEESGVKDISGRRKARRSDDDDEPAAWELPPLHENDAPGRASSEIPEIPEFIEEDNIDATTKPEHQSTSPRREFRHDLLKHQNLGVDALGSPVEALILKNPNRMRRSRKYLQTLEDAESNTGTPLRWQDVLPTEQGPEYDFSDEVYRNIEELRPVDTKILPRRDIDKLLDALVDGFTREQLVGYFNKGSWDEDLQYSDAPSYDWAVKQAPWRAAQPNNWGVLKPKQQHAVLILTTKWGLEVQEQVEGLGRSLVWLKPKVFKLITQPSNPVLETVSAGLLDKASNERISTSHSDSRLGIYASKYTVPLILERINDVVKSMKTKSIDIRNVEKKDLTEPVLRELERITSTTVHCDSGNKELSVSWLSQDSQVRTASPTEGGSLTNTQTEDPADIVSRLLQGRRPMPQRSEARIISSSTSPAKGTFVEHHREKRTMSWRDKMRQWARYVSPVGKEPRPDSKSLALEEQVSLSGKASKISSSQATTRLTATFGHILHTNCSVEPSQMAKSRRILSPVVPHPAALTAIAADADKFVTQSTAIILNFAPDMANAQTQGDDTLPHIRLTLPVDPDADLSAFAFPPDSSLEALVPLHVHDILLPDESVDVRLVQQQLVPLDAQQESLKAFLAVSDFNLLAGRLRTPSHAAFSVPQAWLPSSRSGKQGQEQTTNVPYLFMGLEIHQIVDLQWRGHTLRYNSIEAGQHGGQRQELSLLTGPLPAAAAAPITNTTTTTTTVARDPSPEQQPFESLLQLAEEVAVGKHFSWDEGYMLMQERSDEQFSWDLLDDSSGQEGLVDGGDSIVDEAEEGSDGHGNDAASEGEQVQSRESESLTDGRS
ncbi:hypothetical protein JDV02_010068 [Purpureocillium takamizusanense]|uniref:Uncharacterized protein n=1 Tax=Purpureocillium takamizusanense TaxID=2060973 RepID=A0A9Q8QQ20_9HYPO|nr:uncharacterized protein JDV02_010068 [Purpureocillium takamizusanense]UNI24313.1 hypothetical protein JDV02_010068 [Purpureocillium takamizusanense]